MSDEKVIELVLGKSRNIENTSLTINGLLMAMLICRRRLLDAFDGKDATSVVLGIMEDITKTIDKLKEKSNGDINEGNKRIYY